MESTELVVRLLKGQQNIDRMRREIDTLLNMMIGYVKACGVNVHPDGRTFIWTGKHGRWVMRLSTSVLGKNEVVLEYEIVSTAVAYSSRGGAERLKVKHVEMAHKDLSCFVQGIVKEFPQIEEIWEPIVRASLATFSF